MPEMSTLAFPSELIDKYKTNAPRYTSYPTAMEFQPVTAELDIARAARQSIHDQLSLYIHIPFCHSLCYYCGCNKIVTRQTAKADEYLTYLAQEIHQYSQAFSHHQVHHIHLGGGTPNFLSHSQLKRLMALLRSHFELTQDVEMSIELDPRYLSVEDLEKIASLGFNRISLGIQDIDTQVQKAINRVQPIQDIIKLMDKARALNIPSINWDLVYGLPQQSLQCFANTLAFVEQMQPDRISIFAYAHLPSRFAAQRKICETSLPSAQQKLSLLALAIERLQKNGYRMIGMDHFATTNDPLSIAQEHNRLHRNFQGYTNKGGCDLLGLGVSAISQINNIICQNNKTLKGYYQGLDTNQSVLESCILLDKDDQIRAHVIERLMCNLLVDKHSVSNLFEIEFDDYFAVENIAITMFEKDNLIECTDDAIRVLPQGRFILRAICMQFDAYRRPQNSVTQLSQCI